MKPEEKKIIYTYKTEHSQFITFENKLINYNLELNNEIKFVSGNFDVLNEIKW